MAEREGEETIAVRRSALRSLKRRAFRLSAGKGAKALVRRCEEDSITIGSHEANAFRIAHPTVSRFHARIEVAPEGHLLTDLDSTNGTFAGGLRVKSVFLEPRTRLRFGEVEVAFELTREETELDLAQGDRFGGLWGQSPAMRRLFDILAKLSPTDATVLLQGETGSGKELVAAEIHRHSRRAAGPYVVVDCAGLPDTLIEAELFGHERGAFTGAERARAGAFEEAQGGTLLLDEIAEMPLLVQSKLLRVLEARQVKRLGANEWRPIDVRIIAATHQDLARLANQRQFREDLYFRLSVLTVRVPPLRERLEDLPLLIAAMLEEAGAPQAFPLDETLLEALRARRWTGNVRELRNVVHRALVFGPESLPEGAIDGPPPLETAPGGTARAPGTVEDEPFKVAKARAVEAFERRYLVDLLTRWNGNVARAARAGEVDPAWIFRLVKRHHLDLTELRRR